MHRVVCYGATIVRTAAFLYYYSRGSTGFRHQYLKDIDPVAMVTCILTMFLNIVNTPAMVSCHGLFCPAVFYSTSSVRAYALNSSLEHWRGLDLWSIAEKLQL